MYNTKNRKKSFYKNAGKESILIPPTNLNIFIHPTKIYEKFKKSRTNPFRKIRKITRIVQNTQKVGIFNTPTVNIHHIPKTLNPTKLYQYSSIFKKNTDKTLNPVKIFVLPE